MLKSLSHLKFSACLILAVLLSTHIACAQAQDRVKVGLAIPPSVTQGSVQAIAEELNLFGDENLEVDYVVLPGAGVPGSSLKRALQRRVVFWEGARNDLPPAGRT